MKIRNLIEERENEKVVSFPDLKINDYLTLESGTYIDKERRRASGDFYLGLRFKIKW